MTDDKDNTDNNNFEEDLDFIEESFDEVKTTQVQQPELGAKQWLILLGILGGISYVIYSLFFDHSPKAPQVKPEQTAVIAQTPELTQEDLSFDDIAQAFATEDPIVTPPVTNVTEELVDESEDLFAKQPKVPSQDSLHRNMSALTQKIDESTQQLEKLESTLNTVVSKLDKAEDAVTHSDERLSKLSQQVTALNDEIALLKKEYGDEIIIDHKAEQDKQTQPLIYTGPEYVVHAVIPGRAWLKSSQGQIVTVSEGDSLKDYGSILVIDAANGVVLTSSGIAFR